MTVGRPYKTEMEELAQSLEWANTSHIQDLVDHIQGISDRPLFAVGSGGSLTAAAFWSLLHESATGYPAKFGTPLDLMSLPSVRPYAVGIASARGGNPDHCAGT